MKPDPVQAALQALAEAASRPHEVATLALVRGSLAHKSNHVVSRAARAAREADLATLASDLIAAFPRFLEDPVRRDPGCVASDDRDIARAAAIALGEARRPEAVVALRERLPGEERPDVRHAVILALATSRDDAAFDTLLALVARGGAADSKAAVEALRLYSHDEALQHRVRAALDARRPARRR